MLTKPPRTHCVTARRKQCNDILPELSNFGCLPGTAGGSPNVLGRVRPDMQRIDMVESSVMFPKCQ